MLQILPWSHNSQLKKEGLAFLKQQEETCMFMLSNQQNFGTELSEHLNSGNYYSLLEDQRVTACFVLARRGNLLFQGATKKHIVPILEFLEKNESIALKGVLGPEPMAFEIWQQLKLRAPKIQDGFVSCEILYALEKSQFEQAPTDNTRLLQKQHFETWKRYVESYISELKLTDISTESERQNTFIEKVERKELWGTFEEEQLVSIATLNARFQKLAQVGGVFTPIEKRGKGFSKDCMRQLLHDCFNNLGIEKMILFTSQTSLAAQSVYQSMGFKIIGNYGMYFAKG
ncbi:MAG: GNAT family N-acetyltransferase [Halobacteriovoraceae bacterium]|nr:GNAT family N-acetyltransferase [Halobacteriovoraceae bacterium]MBT5095146.1 GNAT family N-acetyltransferase [Halobacteriovoraceae bacterium]